MNEDGERFDFQMVADIEEFHEDFETAMDLGRLDELRRKIETKNDLERLRHLFEKVSPVLLRGSSEPR